MEAPPSFTPPVKKSGGSKIWLWILLGFGVCCVLPVILLGGLSLWGINKFKDLGACMINIDAVTKGFDDYAAAHNGKLPPAATWQDDIKPYVAKHLDTKGKDTGPIKLMKADGEWGCTNDSGVQYGFAYNTEVAGKVKSALKQDEVLYFEVPHSTHNQAMKYAPQDLATGRQLFGKPFGWLFVRVSGENYLHGEKGDQPMPKTNVEMK